MDWAARWLALFAALHGASGVAFAALGAHGGLASTSVSTGAVMQLIHAAAALGALALAGGTVMRAGVAVLLAGTLAFAGALYVSALTEWSLGMIAPVGGITMIAGWLIIGLAALRCRHPGQPERGR
ncbi:MAG: DUF423 domain-containing protein [Pacificimonas sp.]|jgi:uncharacterized membrane protein YgdD (TMEM256/DUF423 family)|nr:DUF423 domain-containing protein [Pacificimonas sp.]